MRQLAMILLMGILLATTMQHNMKEISRPDTPLTELDKLEQGVVYSLKKLIRRDEALVKQILILSERCAYLESEIEEINKHEKSIKEF